MKITKMYKSFAGLVKYTIPLKQIIVKLGVYGKHWENRLVSIHIDIRNLQLFRFANLLSAISTALIKSVVLLNLMIILHGSRQLCLGL